MDKISVLFDMDGLLLDTEKLYLESFLESCHDFGLPDLTEVYFQSIGLREQEYLPIISEALSGRADPHKFIEHWFGRFDQQLKSAIPLKPGAEELLSHLKAEGHLTAVATSTPTLEARKHLHRAQLLDFFDVIIGGDQVEHGKPAPDIYLRAASELGQKASDCIAFEDSDPGVLAAVRSGAQTVQIPDLKAPSEETRKLRHTIAPSLLEGARAVGLL